MTRINIDIYNRKFWLDSYITGGCYKDYHQTTDETAGKEDAIQFQPARKNSIAVLDSQHECDIFRPGHGFIMHRTVRTTETPVRAIVYITSRTKGLNIYIRD